MRFSSSFLASVVDGMIWALRVSDRTVASLCARGACESKCMIGVCRFPVDVKGEGAVLVTLDADVKHVDASVNFLLLRPFYVWVDGIDMLEESSFVVLVDRDEG